MAEHKNPWDKRFDSNDFVYGKKPNVFLEVKASLLPHGNTLCLAEGEGRNAIFLAKQGYDVTAWDYSQIGLDKCLLLAQEEDVKVSTDLVDITKVEWEEKFWTNVVCIFGHFPSTSRKEILQGIRTCIKPGGMFLTEVYSTHQLKYDTGGPKDRDMLYQINEFLTTFSDWNIIHLFMGEVDRHEGQLHNGISHVIQFLGQKI